MSTSGYNNSVDIILFVYEKNKNLTDMLNRIEKQAAGVPGAEVIIMDNAGEKVHRTAAESFQKENQSLTIQYHEAAGQTRMQLFEAARALISREYVCFFDDGDIPADNWLDRVLAAMKKYDGKTDIVACATYFREKNDKAQSPFSTGRYTKTALIRKNEKDIRVPIAPQGCLLRAETVRSYQMKKALVYDFQKDFMLNVYKQKKTYVETAGTYYRYDTPQESDYYLFPASLNKDWYLEAVPEFIEKLLEEEQQESGYPPLYIQRIALYLIQWRFIMNMNNQNKHALNEDEVGELFTILRRCFALIEDKELAIVRKHSFYHINSNLKRLFHQIKYDDFERDLDYILHPSNAFACWNNNHLMSLEATNVSLECIEFKDGRLEIDGAVDNMFNIDKLDLYVVMNGKRYDLQPSQRYKLTKYFGLSAYKRWAFHLTLPIDEASAYDICFEVEVNGVIYEMNCNFLSHFSKLSSASRFSYWRLRQRIMYYEEKHIYLKPAKRSDFFKREVKLMADMLRQRKWKLFLIRLCYFLTKPVYGKKTIWLFMDKIYKGNDSSEYIYHYARQQDDKITKYYLLDKNVPDYKRQREMGLNPLKRNSFRHLMIFLHADVVVISNSTVMAFNGYRLDNSAYIRDLVNFHVMCVQHGLSVQKIALAQQRLRDNTKLYFCASEAEIKNLSHPIYDYVGYDALRLTGIPRYDGLVDRDKKQILFAPTWRMNSALIVSKSESYQRDYNPFFKETEYYKIYNAIINDKKLIASAKKYGYKIIYLLHPIVSPQVNDFDKNEYVEVLASTSDVSYEKIMTESSVMVTDYSGVQFDFAYMRKPVVYLHHENIPQHYEEGTFFYESMGFGEICKTNDELIDTLCGYMENECAMKPEYLQRANDFFAFDDHNNCERIYAEMIKYQREVIDVNHR